MYYCTDLESDKQPLTVYIQHRAGTLAWRRVRVITAGSRRTRARTTDHRQVRPRHRLASRQVSRSTHDGTHARRFIFARPKIKRSWRVSPPRRQKPIFFIISFIFLTSGRHWLRPRKHKFCEKHGVFCNKKLPLMLIQFYLHFKFQINWINSCDMKEYFCIQTLGHRFTHIGSEFRKILS